MPQQALLVWRLDLAQRVHRGCQVHYGDADEPFARSAGEQTVGWTAGVWDTDRPGAEEIARRTVNAFEPGAIILLHDGGGDRKQANALLVVPPDTPVLAAGATVQVLPLDDALAVAGSPW